MFEYLYDQKYKLKKWKEYLIFKEVNFWEKNFKSMKKEIYRIRYNLNDISRSFEDHFKDHENHFKII